jgi:hypothetical protein
LANEIAAASRSLRLERSRQMIQRSLEALDAQLLLQEATVDDARARMLDLMDKYRIIDGTRDHPDEVDSGTLDTLRRLVANTVEAEGLARAAHVRLDIATQQKKGDVSLLRGLEAEATLSRERRILLAKQVGGVVERAMDERRNHIDYANAKRDYATQERIRTKMRERLLTDRISAAMPREPVVLHESAEISHLPVDPDTNTFLPIGIRLGLKFALVAFALMLLLRAFLTKPAPTRLQKT